MENKKQIILDNILFDYYIYDDGRCQNIITGKFLKGSVTQGYKNYYLRKGTIQKSIGAHRLVALMFLKNENNYPIVHHIDENKLNNNVKNLQWVTASENALAISDKTHFSNKRKKYQYYENDLEDEEWAFYHNTHLKFSSLGRLLNTSTNRILIQHKDKNGYCYYSPKIDGKTKKILTHRGVYEAFYNCFLKKEEQIDHIDGNKSNNCLSNLRKTTPQENCQFRSDFKRNLSNYQIGQFDSNNELIAVYKSQAEAARCTGLSSGGISLAIREQNLYKNFYWKIIFK